MAILLRARHTCHYCGKRNGPSNNQRKFTCQYCQADNFLDQSGNITDIPPTAFVPTQQYAIPRTPALENTEGSIFCSTCLKNQFMYNTALSEYLPDPDHPEYERFEAAIPEFKKDLERRFPTCCLNCEPKVKAQLERATYNARSDHLRRVLDRSRQRRNANRWGWRSLLVNAAGLGWLISLLVQLIWHGLGSQAHGKADSHSIRPSECLTSWPIPADCPNIMETFVGPSLLLGVLSLWWNPKWNHRLEGREGRLVGLDKFYKVQGALLALRFILWTVIKDVPNLNNFRSMIHTVSLVFISMIAIWSNFSIIQVYMPRIVDWSQDPAPLLDGSQYVPPLPAPLEHRHAIPVNVFGTTNTSGPQPWRPPTPPIDDDVMEWDPTPTSFSPNPKKAKYKSTEPTPFHGTLPAFPRGGIYNTQNEIAIEQPEALGLPIGFFDRSHGRRLDGKVKENIGGAGWAQPKFFPDANRADTGLESIFDKVFSIQDEAQIPRRRSSGAKTRPNVLPNQSGLIREDLPVSRPRLSIDDLYIIFVNGVLALFGILLSAQFYFELPFLQVTSMENMLRILMAIPLVNRAMRTFLSQATSDSRSHLSDNVASIVESCVFLGLYFTRPEQQSTLLTLWNNLLIGSVVYLLTQQIYSVYVTKTPPAETLIHGDSPDMPEQEVIIPTQFEPQASWQPLVTESRTVRRTSSDESLASTASITTTSTAPGWKTPTRNHREELYSSNSASTSTSYGFGGLSLKNDHKFGSSNSVAGPRTRRTPARGGQRVW